MKTSNSCILNSFYSIKKEDQRKLTHEKLYTLKCFYMMITADVKKLRNIAA